MSGRESNTVFTSAAGGRISSGTASGAGAITSGFADRAGSVAGAAVVCADAGSGFVVRAAWTAGGSAGSALRSGAGRAIGGSGCVCVSGVASARAPGDSLAGRGDGSATCSAAGSIGVSGWLWVAGGASARATDVSADFASASFVSVNFDVPLRAVALVGARSREAFCGGAETKGAGAGFSATATRGEPVDRDGAAGGIILLAVAGLPLIGGLESEEAFDVCPDLDFDAPLLPGTACPRGGCSSSG